MSATLPHPSTPQAQPGPESEGPQSVLRRSSRNTTPVRRSGMIATASIPRRPTNNAAPASSTRPTSSDVAPSSRISHHTNSTISNNHQRTNDLDLSSSAVHTQTDAAVGNAECATTTPTQTNKKIVVIDLAQDSGGGNAKINKKRKRDKDNNYDVILNYFGEPFHINGDDKSEDPITYICRWCNSQVRGGQGSDSNLYSHCDGKLQKGRTGNRCRKRENAIKSGVKLPPTVSQLHKVAQATKNQKINTFFGPAEKFDNVVLNRTLTVWLIRHALPWTRVEDEELQASFHYTQPGSQIFKWKWQAKSGQLLYLDLQTSMIESLKTNSSRFTLIHNVWTTKGNRYGFIGASITYVNDDWEYITTDSGSNNNTMAKEMYDQLQSLPGANWNPARMHIKCFCHKLALIVAAGLKELGMRTPPPPQVRRVVLGRFPLENTMETIAEEDEYDDEPVANGEEELEENVDEDEEIDGDDSDGDDKEEKSGDDENDSDQDEEQVGSSTGGKNKSKTASNHSRSNELNELTKSLDFVIRKITGSATWRQKFKAIALAKGLDLLDLIAGYGIRWNIKYESRKRAYDACAVIDQMLKEEFDMHVAKKSRSRRKDKSKSGHFNGILLDASDWRSLNELNEELEVFMVLTKEMEGDGPTGALVLPKYHMLKQTLIEKENDCGLDDPLYPMFQKMIKKLTVYLDEALGCETLVMATLLHPAFRLAAFEVYFPTKKDLAKKILTKYFHERKTELESKKKKNSTIIDKEPEPTQEKRKTKLANLFHSSSAKAENDELTVFLKGGDVFEMDERSAKYPVLSSLARDYLACSASSCSAERTFSAAADVCSSNCGKLLPRTIEMCVSSRMWLKGEVPLTGEFAAADKLLKRYVAFKESKQSKTTGGNATT
ncbi:hypothetical protein MJO28_002178 [Puccinia striiformis f. sp. tritici]|uniref:Uncharacterized protein n=1 Tax=Puccinia striiformis f. sp. tritici TaxID=168172 RepID=A0ACC0EXA1_9BASI|nr:hypothetical protein MJO28_002178 [Puccinia striiformis f. sp. tritici]